LIPPVETAGFQSHIASIEAEKEKVQQMANEQ
jgi:hypothetical protein